MKRLLRQAKISSPDSTLMLNIIDQFDQLAASGASLGKFAKVANRLSGRPVTIYDSWNGRAIQIGSDGQEQDVLHEASTAAVIAAAVSSRLRGRRSSILTVGDREVLAANLESATGRIGIVWLEQTADGWFLKDHIIAERLAAAVVTEVVTKHALLDSKSTEDSSLIQQILLGGLNLNDIETFTREAKLPVGKQLVAIAIGEHPRSATSPEALAQIATRALARVGVSVQSTVMGLSPALIVVKSPKIDQALEDLGNGTLGSGSVLSFGIGSPVEPENLHRSWKEAKESLLLRSLTSPDRRVANFSDLGLLHLLAQIPAKDVVESSDYKKISALADSGTNPTDLELLEVFCDSGSLRLTASAVFLHFTSVRTRVLRIGEVLDLDLNQVTDRFRAHVAVKLVQIHRARQLDDATFTAVNVQKALKQKPKNKLGKNESPRLSTR